MIDSRAKGRAAELKCRDELRKLTGLMWERTPMSGALNEKHMMKGDVYVPQTNIKYCVEVKHYADDHISTKLLTTKSVFYNWWEQTTREAEQMKKEPLLVFKHNRSKWFVAFTSIDPYFSITESETKNLIVNPGNICICLLTDFCKYEEFI
jgi:hypothetical protein